MRIVFFGTSEFAATILNDLRQSSHKIVAVVTRADKKSGRHLKVVDSPVKHEAKRLGVPIFQPAQIHKKGFIDELRSFKADFFVVIAFGTILPKTALDIPSYCCLNVHASLLPKYRGAAPVHWALVNGEDVTGLTIIRMNERLDAGDIVLQKEFAIQSEDDSETLDHKIAKMGAALLTDAMEAISKGEAQFRPQDEKKVTLAPKLKKEDGRIDWAMPSQRIINRVRGLRPWPGTYTYLEGRTLKVFSVKKCREANYKGYAAGEVITAGEREGLTVKTGDSALAIVELQLDGKKRMTSTAFLRGHKIAPHTKLG